MVLDVINAQFRLATPAFPAGASPRRRVELQTQTILGALSVWNTHAGQFHGARDRSVTSQELFGFDADSVPSNNPNGRFLLSFDRRPQVAKVEWSERSGEMDLIGYIGKTRPEMMASGTEFSISALAKPGCDPRHIAGVMRAFRTLGLLGGLGGGSRRGFGSINIIGSSDGPEAFRIPDDFESYRASLRDLAFADARDDGKDPSIYLKAIEGSWVECVREVAQELGVKYNAWKAFGKGRGPRHPSVAHFHIQQLGDHQALACLFAPFKGADKGLTANILRALTETGFERLSGGK